MPNKLEAGAGADVDGADVLVIPELELGALSFDSLRLGNRLLEGALEEGADAPTLLGGLLKKPNALGAGAVVDDDTGSVVED